jgi:hypothetical protein
MFRNVAILSISLTSVNRKSVLPPFLVGQERAGKSRATPRMNRAVRLHPIMAGQDGPHGFIVTMTWGVAPMLE